MRSNLLTQLQHTCCLLRGRTFNVNSLPKADARLYSYNVRRSAEASIRTSKPGQNKGRGATGKKKGRPPKKDNAFKLRGKTFDKVNLDKVGLDPIVGLDNVDQGRQKGKGSSDLFWGEKSPEPTTDALPVDAPSSDAPPESRPEIGALLDLECGGLSSSGKGVCKTETGFVVFVPSAIPGEKLQANVTRVKPGFAEAERVSVQEESPHKSDPECKHYDECGGCNQQHIAYDQQVHAKNERVRETLRRIGHFRDIEALLKDPIACPDQYRYRNKVTFSVATDPEWLLTETQEELKQQPKIGLHKGQDSAEVEEIEDCLLQDSSANTILSIIKEHITTLQTEAEVVFTRIVIRRGSKAKAGQTAHMVILFSTQKLVTNPASREQQAIPFQSFVEELIEKVPSIVSIYDCRATLGREKAYPVLNRLLGVSTLDHVVNGNPFRVSPLSFFQVNTEQAGNLVNAVYEAAGLRKGDRLLDMFCGVGLMGISLALRMKANNQPLAGLLGYEVYNQAVNDARSNLKVAGLDKKKAVVKAADLSQPTIGAKTNCNVVVCDPARAGLPSPVIDFLMRCQARTLVYVSCDVATLARDLHRLCHIKDRRVWRLESVQLCDMFPQTSHTETIAVLRRQVTWEAAPQKNAYVKMTAAERSQFVYDKAGLRE